MWDFFFFFEISGGWFFQWWFLIVIAVWLPLSYIHIEWIRNTMFRADN